MSKVTFRALGGANSVGASCYILHFGNFPVMLDCGAGVHTPDPDLSQAGNIEVVCCSHGHRDHIGRVPLIHRYYPQARVYMSYLTRLLAINSWEDELEVAQKENRSCPFSHYDTTVTQSSRRLRDLYPGQERKLSSDLSVTAYGAGHILGAVLYIFTYKGLNYVFTGDISLKPHTFVAGADVPKLSSCELLIRESTYAGQWQEQSRKAVKSNLIKAIREVYKAGGRVVIPAPVIDRMQETSTTLQEAKIDHRVVGGMVATDIYQQYADGGRALTKMSRFGTGKEGWNAQMNAMGSNYPIVVIASSGMVNPGTASYDWVRSVMDEPKNAVFFVCYQDPFGFGGKILASRLGDELDGFQRNCRIERFHLSTHAQEDEMQELEHRLNPKTIIHVHGEDRRIQSFIDSQKDIGPPRIKAIVGQEIDL